MKRRSFLKALASVALLGPLARPLTRRFWGALPLDEPDRFGVVDGEGDPASFAEQREHHVYYDAARDVFDLPPGGGYLSAGELRRGRALMFQVVQRPRIHE